jgi:hypothetical protein
MRTFRVSLSSGFGPRFRRDIDWRNAIGPDEDILEAADAEGCILITEDRDFSEQVIRHRLGVCGMILLSWIAFRMRRKLMWSSRSLLSTPTGYRAI